MDPNILCVHQIGKVGSTTVAHMLQRMFPARKVHQTHVLSCLGVLRMMEVWLDRPKAPRFHLADHLVSSIELRRYFSAGAPAVCWHLITLVRDPLGRNVSAFFQNLHKTWLYRLTQEEQVLCRRLLKSDQGADQVADADELHALVQSLIKLFKKEYGFRSQEAWFEQELRDPFGIDVFAEPFSADRGYHVYRQGRTALLLMRLEDLQRVFASATAEWLEGSPLALERDGAPAFERERANDGSSKAYSDLYQSFLANFRVSSSELADIYDSRAARHFYTPQELANFQARWSLEASESIVA